MRGSFRVLTVRGINLYVHWTLLIPIAWIAIINAQLGNDVLQLTWSLLFIAAVLVCIFLHELGHALMARRFGIQAHNIVLLPVGGIASIEKFPEKPGQELAISLAGPMVNLAIAGLIWLLLPAGTSFFGSPFQYGASVGTTSLADLGTVNLLLALFNLIPAFPMDGGRILRALLAYRLNYLEATTIAANVGKVFAIFFIAIGIVMINLLLPLIGIFIFAAAGTEEYYLRIKSLATGVTLSEAVMYEYNGLQSSVRVSEAAPVLLSNHSKYFLLMEGSTPVAALNRLVIIEAIAERKYQDTLGSLAKEEVDCLDASLPVTAVLEKLAAHEDKIFPVLADGRFVGVVSLQHIIEYLLVHKTDSQDHKRLKSLVTLLH